MSGIWVRSQTMDTVGASVPSAGKHTYIALHTPDPGGRAVKVCACGLSLAKVGGLNPSGAYMFAFCER